MKIQIGDEVRDMTADELTNYKQIMAEQAAQIDAHKTAVAVAAAACTKLKALGLTDAEVAILVGE